VFAHTHACALTSPYAALETALADCFPCAGTFPAARFLAYLPDPVTGLAGNRRCRCLSAVATLTRVSYEFRVADRQFLSVYCFTHYVAAGFGIGVTRYLTVCCCGVAVGLPHLPQELPRGDTCIPWPASPPRPCASGWCVVAAAMT